MHTGAANAKQVRRAVGVRDSRLGPIDGGRRICRLYSAWPL